MNNPFSLKFGALPEQFISRPVLTNRILDDFMSEKPGSQTYMLTGVRGSGKTVMLTEISKKLKDESDWVVVELNPEEDMMQSLAAKLYNIEKVRPMFVKAKVNVSFGGAGVSFENYNPGITSEVVVEKMLEVLSKHNKRLLVTIDEAANNVYVKRFAHSFQIFIRQDHPIYLIMTGLYENIYELQNEKTLTFLYRVPRIVLDPLNIAMIAASYGTIFETDEKEAMRMALLTKGYPFAFQVLGYIRWENKGKALDELLSEYDQYLAEYIYDKIWHELSDNDRKVVLAMAEGEEYAKVQTIRETLGMSSGLFSTYRDKMIRKGLVDTRKYGYLSLILPRFKEYAIARNNMDM